MNQALSWRSMENILLWNEMISKGYWQRNDNGNLGLGQGKLQFRTASRGSKYVENLNGMTSKKFF